MTDHRDPDQRMKHDVWRAKQLRNNAVRVVQLQRETIAQLQADTIRVCLHGWLLRLEDFNTYIGLERVLDADHRVDLQLLQLQVSDLLRRRPELAVPVDTQPPIER